MSAFAKPACLAACLALAACTGGIAPDAIEIDNDGGGRFSGFAGPEWTQAEVARMVGGTVCGGPPPRQFNTPSFLDGNMVFSGVC